VGANDVDQVQLGPARVGLDHFVAESFRAFGVVRGRRLMFTRGDREDNCKPPGSYLCQVFQPPPSRAG